VFICVSSSILFVCYNIIYYYYYCHLSCCMFDDPLIFHSPLSSTQRSTSADRFIAFAALDRWVHPHISRSIDRSGTTTPHASIHHYSYIALHLMTEDWRRHININRNPLHTITNTLPYASRSKSSSSRVNNNYGKSSTLIIILHTYVYHDGNISISIRYILFNYLLGRM
jgi:hypothetical protein